MKSKSSSQLPPVSSRHLDRLKGLLAKTEGTVALGGRSDDETRFGILYSNGSLFEDINNLNVVKYRFQGTFYCPKSSKKCVCTLSTFYSQ